MAGIKAALRTSRKYAANAYYYQLTSRVVFVSRGTSRSLDLTFPPTGLSENLGGMERGGEGKGRVGRPPALLPSTGFCLKYHPG